MTRNPDANDNRPRRRFCGCGDLPGFICYLHAEGGGREETMDDSKPFENPIGFALGEIARRRRNEQKAMAAFNDSEVAGVDPSLLHEVYSACVVMGGRDAVGAVVLNFRRRVAHGGAT